MRSIFTHNLWTLNIGKSHRSKAKSLGRWEELRRRNTSRLYDRLKKRRMAAAMITVEILIAIGVACIATALLATLTDEDDDEAIGVPQSIAKRGRGR